MSKSSAISLAITAFLMVGAPSHAERILHLDASDPGSNPNNIWVDLSPSDHHFSNDGATYNEDDNSYDFDGTSVGLTGPAAPNESAFDFTIDDPFSIVVYYKSTGNGRFTDTLINKSDDDFNAGWNLMAAEVGGEAHLGIAYMFMRASDNQDRAYRKAGEGQISPNPFIWHMVMVTVASNDNTTAAYEFYRDGDSTPLAESYDDEPSVDLPPITQDFPVRIGYENFSGSNPPGARFFGQIGIIEIWDETLPASYIQTRWNGGNPARASEEPPPLTVVVPSSPVAMPDVAVVEFEGVGGSAYSLESTMDLIGGTWSGLIGSYTPPADGTYYLYDLTPASVVRSYRVVEM